MKNIFTFLAALILSGAMYGQQPAQYSLYMLNKFAFNPAYAGMDNSLSLTGIYRKQWSGLNGSPETQNFNAHMPLYIAGGGIGMGLENETIGSWKQTSLSLAYDYQMQIGKSGILSMGLSAGLVQRQLDGSKVRTPGTEFLDEGVPSNHNDPILTINTETGTGATFNAGLFYQSEKLEAGLSAVNLLENELDLSTLKFKQERNYYFFLGYSLDMGKNLSLHPSVLLKTDVRQTQIDFSLLVRYNENIFAGGSFRGYHSESIDAVALMGGFKLSEKITAGLAYDLGLSDLKSVNNGSYEIFLNYNLGKPIGKGRPPIIIYNPRSL
jgi:type IX secretion system PorP/SprF family membrane protein